MRKNNHCITFLLFTIITLQGYAQDSLQKVGEQAQVSPQSATSLTPVQEASRQRRRKKAALNDSVLLAIQRTGAMSQPIIPSSPIVTPSIPTTTNVEKSDNPFDILRGQSDNLDTSNATAQSNAAPIPSLLNRETYSKNFIFWVFLVVLILMAFVVAGGRSAINTAYKAMMSDNALRQIYKEPFGWGSVGYLALYALFWINMGIFIFLLMSYYKMKIPFGSFGTFMACVFGFGGLVMLKHTVLYLVAKVFPIEKEVRTYNFIILTAGILLGLVLMPINIFIAYSPPSVSSLFVYLGLVLVGVAYLVRSLRSLPITASFLIDNRFHFLLYLCTIEIAPVVIITKIVLSNS